LSIRWFGLGEYTRPIDVPIGEKGARIARDREQERNPINARKLAKIIFHSGLITCLMPNHWTLGNLEAGGP
jgi:hypothetical protein